MIAISARNGFRWAVAARPGRWGGSQKGGKDVTAVWVTLLSEAAVLTGAAALAVKWVRRSPASTPESAEQPA